MVFQTNYDEIKLKISAMASFYWRNRYFVTKLAAQYFSIGPPHLQSKILAMPVK